MYYLSFHASFDDLFRDLVEDCPGISLFYGCLESDSEHQFQGPSGHLSLFKVHVKISCFHRTGNCSQMPAQFTYFKVLTS